jgi:hypothetical protein
MCSHPNHRCSQCQRQFAADRTLYMAAAKPIRYRRRLAATVPVCDACLSPGEREIAASASRIACLGCRHLVARPVPLFARTTCSPACQMRVERRLSPKPLLPLKTDVSAEAEGHWQGRGAVLQSAMPA